MKTSYVIITIIVIALIGAGIGYQLNKPDLGGTATFVSYAGDVIGTKTGTTTVGANFSVTGSGGQSATSTYVTKLSNYYNEATYTAQVKQASSSANIHVVFLGSNDDYCDTATTTSGIGNDVVIMGQINWFDVSNHLLNLSATETFYNGTSTLVWDTSGLNNGAGKEMTLTDLNYECLALQVSGSSTVLWAQVKLK